MKIVSYLHVPISCAAPGERRRPVARSRREWVILAAVTLAIGSLTFAMNLKLGNEFMDFGLFRQYDVLFHSDPYPIFNSLDEGAIKSSGFRRYQDFVHPNFLIYLYPFIQTGAEILTGGKGDTSRGKMMRHTLIVLIAPVTSVVKSVCVLWIMIGLGLTLSQAIPITLISVLSFSQIIFGSIPESFPISGMLLALTSLLAVQSYRRGSRRWQWILIAALMMGVTITNVISVALLFLLMRLFAKEKVLHAVLDTTAVIGIGIAITVLIAFSFGSLKSAGKVSHNAQRYVKAWSVKKPLHLRAAVFPKALVNTVIAPIPTKVYNHRAALDRSKYKFRFTLDASPAVFSLGRIPDLSLLIFFGAGLLGCWRGAGVLRYVGVGSAAIVVFNWMLHTLWGVEYFLYSQHWHISFLIPLAGLFSLSIQSRPYWTLGVFAFLILMIVKNWNAMNVIWIGVGA